VSGALSVVAGVGLLAVSATLNPVPHLGFGPGLAPAAVGLGLLMVGGVLLARTARSKTPAPDPARRGRPWGFLLTLALPLVLAGALPHVGMTVGIAVMLAPLLAWHTRRPLCAVVGAVVFAVVLTGLVRGVLGVPLPEGRIVPDAPGLPWI
jgi:hypothetical protein